MKIMASILIVYFGFLMVQPFADMCAVKVKPAKTCHAGMCDQKKNHQHGANPCSSPSNCNADFCNPFVPCGFSIISRTAQPNFTNPVRDLSKNIKPAANEDITSNYLSDCWRPPELS
jgi:hypothetical protein